MSHMELATWADLIVVYPATAAALARIAGGNTGDLVTAMVVAARGPVLIAPSMNDGMIESPSVQRNLAQLRADGHHLLWPKSGHEVATPPAARRPIRGAAPPPHEVVRAIELLVRRRPVESDWEATYATMPAERLPWFTNELDGDLAEALRALGSTGAKRLIDVGTGLGTTAAFAAQLGFDVVATDVSTTALGLARRRAQALPIAWVLDDFAATRLWGEFDVVIDRGCLHCLSPASWPRYAENAARLVRPGGALLLKEHAPEEGPPRYPSAVARGHRALLRRSLPRRSRRARGVRGHARSAAARAAR